jgi:hypothetical protein
MEFDTLYYANKPKAASVPDAQAIVHAEALAAKQDLKILESNLNLKMANLKIELIGSVLGVAVGQAAIIVACIKLIY